MDDTEKLAYQYCQDTPTWGQVIVRGGAKGILFTAPDEPVGGTFIPFSDLGYSQDIGFYRKSEFPDLGSKT